MQECYNRSHFRFHVRTRATHFVSRTFCHLALTYTHSLSVFPVARGCLCLAELAFIFVQPIPLPFISFCLVRFQFPFKISTLSFMNVMGESIYGNDTVLC